MRALRKNKQTLYYALYDREVVEYDADGNETEEIRYDVDGNEIIEEEEMAEGA